MDIQSAFFDKTHMGRGGRLMDQKLSEQILKNCSSVSVRFILEKNCSFQFWF